MFFLKEIKPINFIIVNESPKHNFTTVEAVIPKHDLVEVESTGETLGSKYYENTKKPQLIEADSKEPSTKLVEASANILKSDVRKMEEIIKLEKQIENMNKKGKINYNFLYLYNIYKIKPYNLFRGF